MSPFAAFRAVIVHSCVLRHTLLSLLLACASGTPSGMDGFHNDITHLVVVDSLKQPLASKSDRRPVGMLHFQAELSYCLLLWGRCAETPPPLGFKYNRGHNYVPCTIVMFLLDVCPTWMRGVA
jgi:hypothetical protein